MVLCTEFRAVAHELFGNEDAHAMVRTRAVSHLEKHQEKFEMFVGTAKEYDKLLTTMKR